MKGHSHRSLVVEEIKRRPITCGTLNNGKVGKTKVEHLAQRPHCMARPTKAELFVKKECWLIYLSKVLIRFLYGNEQLTDNIWLRSSVGSSTPG